MQSVMQHCINRRLRSNDRAAEGGAAPVGYPRLSASGGLATGRRQP